ncbi:hypothetical protein [Microbacterium sp.]|uniref:hypothetical protein n=2 Tax=Microbacterium TaxID=33882 RepID=UPI001ACE6606|nr:hypothetical protein [Microbacterium sp.]MBN9159299.1 hypothetical protein [Microbacterium sp.]
MSRPGSVPHALFAEKARAFLDVHRGQDSTYFAGNLVTRIDAVTAGDLILPVTVNDASEPPGNAWVCSPTTTYGRYALEESERLLPGLLRPPLRATIAGVDRGMRRRRLDRAVAVDNWLLSTNLHPDLPGIDLNRLVREARERWPEHAIWIRSLNAVQHPDWLRAAAEAGFTLIPSRQVYLFRDLSAARPSRDLRRDLRLLDRTELTAVHHDAFTEEDFAQAERLYAQLYLHKYSTLNPRYSAAFLRAWHRAGLLELAGFRDAEGTLRAVVGMFGQGAALTAPVVGYDTSWPQQAGLYRLLMAHVLRSTRQRGAELNLSAGAAQFKRLRGGEPAIEYSAVQAAHLPAATRRAITALGALASRVGVPIMRRWEL